MPYIHTVTSASVSDAQEVALKQKLGKAIECFAGKNYDRYSQPLENMAYARGVCHHQG